MISVFIFLFAYGSREFIYGETINVIVRNSRERRVQNISHIPFESVWFITNDSPYKIQLEFISGFEFNTTYNGEILRPMETIFVVFRSNERGVIETKWIRD